MAYDFKLFKGNIAGASEWLRKEFASIRTGRAAPAILDVVSVESYGAKMGIGQLASISIEDVRSLRITPYDLSQSKNIEKAIVQSNLGLSVSIDDRGLRVIFPELTSERRESYLKVAKEKLEEARKKIRSFRDEVWKDIQNKEREKKISEDEKFRMKEDMEKIVQDTSKSFDDQFSRKEKEIRS